MLENPMVHGKGVYDNGQFDAPKKRYRPVEYTCPICSFPLVPEEKVYLWESMDDKPDAWVCGPCLVDSILHMTKAERIELTENKNVESDLLMACNNPDRYAELFGVRVKEAEEVA
jgi:hypothetical protein